MRVCSPGLALALFGLLAGCKPSTMSASCHDDTECPGGARCVAATGLCEEAEDLTSATPPPDLSGTSADLTSGPDLSQPTATTLTADWSRRFGSSGLDYGSSIAIDPNGDVIFSGQPALPFDLDGVTVPASPFVGKLDRRAGTRTPSGWVKSLPGAVRVSPVFYAHKQIVHVATDGDGNVLVTASFTGKLSVTCADGSALDAGVVYDAYVLKLKGQDGACLWAKQIKSGSVFPYGITTNSKGDVFVVGSYGGTATYNAMTFPSIGGTDIFVAQYSTLGVPVKFKRFGSNGDDGATGVAVDRAGQVLVGGYFSKGLIVGADVPANLGGFDIFVTRLGADLEPLAQSTRAYGGSGSDVPMGLAVGPAGDVAIAGRHQATVDFNAAVPGRDVLQTADTNGFLLMLDGALQTRWVKGFGGTTTADVGVEVAFDNTGGVLVGGIFKGTSTLGSAAMVTSLDQDAFLGRYSVVDGGKALTFVLGDQKLEDLWGIARGPDDDVAVIGMSNSDPLKLGAKSWPAIGDYDIFIARWVATPTVVLP